MIAEENREATYLGATSISLAFSRLLGSYSSTIFPLPPLMQP
jgi:hypothetical protein